jgi:dethiobiotin synthetase
VSLFITGTDTGVGKTHIAARLLHLLRASGISCAGMKPICCGDRRDAQTLLAAGSDCVTIDQVNPVWLKTPAAPIVGALTEGVTVDIEQILATFRSLKERVEHVIVEGTGRWLVPIRSDYFVSDLDAAMKLPGLVVALNRLGCLNHAALTVQSVGCAPTSVRRACIKQYRYGERHSGIDKCRYFGAYSRCSIARRTRRKPDGTTCGLATYARVDQGVSVLS